MFLWTVIAVLTFFSFTAAWARDEGTLDEDKFIGPLLADSFDFFRLPTHGLFWETIRTSSKMFYVLTLFVNVTFWSFIMERGVYWVQKLFNDTRPSP